MSAGNANDWSAVPRLMVFEPLIRIENDGGTTPVLAQRVENLSARAMRVWLRTDAAFSDGSAVTAADVARSLESAALKVSSENGSILIESAEATTPVEMRVAEAYVHRQHGGVELGTGPFALVEQDDRHMVLRNRTSVPGHVTTVTLNAYDTAQEALGHLLQGEADVLPQINPRWVEFLDGISRLRIAKLSSPLSNGVAFNTARLSQAERLNLARLLRVRDLRILAFGDGDDCSAPDGELKERQQVRLPERKLEISSFPNIERFGLALGRTLGEHAGDLHIHEPSEFGKFQDFDLLTFRPRASPVTLALEQWRTGAVLASLVRYSNPRLDAALNERDWPAAQRELASDPPFVIVCNIVATAAIDARIRNVASTQFWQSVGSWEVGP
ncbi:MAG TPA: hypothetical protein VH083_26135 [Myxococcales bacterium]|nr:hypothetical protein [Myxococcales bacterium]